MGAKRVKLSHLHDEVAACDTWLSTSERKNVIILAFFVLPVKCGIAYMKPGYKDHYSTYEALSRR